MLRVRNGIGGGVVTDKELLGYVPHPKRCMADAFDSKPGVTCNEPRAFKHTTWFPGLDTSLGSCTPVIHLCSSHETYYQNGGKCGPIGLRAAAEMFQAQKLASAPIRRVGRKDKEKADGSGG